MRWIDVAQPPLGCGSELDVSVDPPTGIGERGEHYEQDQAPDEAQDAAGPQVAADELADRRHDETFVRCEVRVRIREPGGEGFELAAGDQAQVFLRGLQVRGGGVCGAVHGAGGVAEAEALADVEEEGFLLLIGELAQRGDEGGVLGIGDGGVFDQEVVLDRGALVGMLAGELDGVAVEPVFGVASGVPLGDDIDAAAEDGAGDLAAGIGTAGKREGDAVNADEVGGEELGDGARVEADGLFEDFRWKRHCREL